MAGNMNQMMKKAQKMQKQMEFAQSQIDKQEFQGKSPEDLVTATLTGDYQVKDIRFDPKAVDPDDLDMLSDLTVSAINDAEKTVKKHTKQVMGKYTKGMPK